MRKSIILSAVLLATLRLAAQAPQGYYDAAQGLSGQELRAALRDIIDNHTSISYNALWTAYRTTDLRPNGKIWDIYSECTFTPGNDQCGNYSSICDCYNREHTVPQSWFNEQSPMKSDIFHVLPTDGKVNGMRSSYPFGECANGTTYGLGRLGTCTSPGYSSVVFEPHDDYKGDIARIYFYMATRYMNQLSSWDGESFSGNDLSDWTRDMMVRWHQQDPVSQKEIDRNNAIFEHIQHNRNPFVDHPEWVATIWGDYAVVEPPAAFAAEPSSATSIALSWQLNAAGDDILLAYNTTNQFGDPQPDNTLAGAGQVLAHGQLTSFQHTELEHQTTYYKLWSKDCNGFFSAGVVAYATPYVAEPAQHATAFRATHVTENTVALAWTDAGGAPLPTAYLVLAGTAPPAAPADGSPVADGQMAKNIDYGIREATFQGLQPQTTYHFAIYPYSNSGAGTDYKTDEAPTTTAYTGQQPGGEPQLVITEIGGRGHLGDFNNEYIEISNLGDGPATLDGWTLDYYEDGLEASVPLSGTVAPMTAFVVAARTSHTAALPADLTPDNSFSINNPCYVVLRQGDQIADQAGDPNDHFDAKNANQEFVRCGDDNQPTANWQNLGGGNGTPGAVNCQPLTTAGCQPVATVITAYPNPAGKWVTISGGENGEILIINCLGEIQIRVDAGVDRIDISHLPNGLYIARGQNSATTFIKQ